MPALVQFNPVPYPLWRRDFPAPVKAVLRPALRRFMPVDADEQPPDTPEAMAAYLARWGLLHGRDEGAACDWLRQHSTPVETVRLDAAPRPAPDDLVRLPAQWERLEAVILAWPVLYPALWAQHAQMVEAIAPVADVVITILTPMWAQAVNLFLNQRQDSLANRPYPEAPPVSKSQSVYGERLRFLHLPTDDIWVRDYGPIVGYGADSGRVCVKTVYDPLPRYPQQRDDAMAERWAAHETIPVRHLDLHLEGGNLWTDGAGTLILSEQVFYSNPSLSRAALEARLHAVFDFQKLIITPRLKREETGHVDLLVKLASADTVLVSTPTVWLNSDRLRTAADVFRRETNAAGQLYRVLELPSPPLYLNWGVYPIWRSYTNALTVNGRVLVPVFGIPDDERALAVYRQAMPDYDIIPIDSRASVNGGGAVHCLTHEIPA
ncbi:MAG: agmatine deiminase family protein [Chloroflexi bacterium]|nr:agmatine deiminase family protein [Chloroflexota bacterium]